MFLLFLQVCDMSVIICSLVIFHRLPFVNGSFVSSHQCDFLQLRGVVTLSSDVAIGNTCASNSG